MYYEVYADSLFLLQFFLNFYLLALTNCLLYSVASLKRILKGAVLGAFCTVIPFFFPIDLRVGMASGFLLSVGVMSKYTFRIIGKKQWLQLIEKLFFVTLLMGGLLLIGLKWWCRKTGSYPGMSGVFVLGTIIYCLLNRMIRKKRTGEQECEVILKNGEKEKKIEALLDTGNTLVEPISGKPVSIVTPTILTELLGDEIPELYRVVPFRSVGKEHGILKAYLLKQMVVEVQGIRKKCDNVYIAVSEEFFREDNGYEVILHPGILCMAKGEV